METLKIAIELETEAREYFTTLAEKCSYHEGIRYILLMLAGKQEKLIEVINGKIVNTPSEADDSDFYEKSKAVFTDLRSKIDSFSCEIDHLNLYRHAQDLMLRTRTLYESKAFSSEAQAVILFWQQIALEKKKQIILLDNIIELILRPEQWVESPEFTRLDEY